MSTYDIAGYAAMVADQARYHAYRDALREKVGAGTTVLDIGTGTGLHAFVACQLGARHVYSVEPADYIQVAREIARDNRLSDRITFIQEISTRARLPEPVDLVVSDLRGVLPLFAGHIPAIIDARERHLRAGGAMIPLRDRLRAAPVEPAAVYDHIVGPWERDDRNIDMSAARRLATNRVHRKRVEADDLLAAPRTWATIEYAEVTSPNARGAMEFRIDRAAQMRGIAAWFDGDLTDKVRISGAPGEPELVYGMAFFPLPEAVAVGAGDTVRLELAANMVGDDYVWRWNTEVIGSDGGGARFAQSSFDGSPISQRSLALGASDFAPRLSRDGAIDRDALQMIDGGATLRQIAERLAQRYPDAFAGPRHALDRVAALARRYAE